MQKILKISFFLIVILGQNTFCSMRNEAPKNVERFFIRERLKNERNKVDNLTVEQIKIITDAINTARNTLNDGFKKAGLPENYFGIEALWWFMSMNEHNLD